MTLKLQFEHGVSNRGLSGLFHLLFTEGVSLVVNIVKAVAFFLPVAYLTTIIYLTIDSTKSRMKYIFTLLVVVSLTFTGLIAQNTVGLLSYEPMNSYDGYNLIFPHNQADVYLINQCGQIVHTWEDSAQYRPGNTAYLMENGNLVKAKRRFDNNGNDLHAGGGGGTVEIRDWDNNLKYTYTLNDSLHRLHHDIAVTPEGTILMITWERKSLAEAIEAGRDTAQLEQDQLWPDYIIEIDPALDSIIWEWHVWDHLIQDRDPTISNFGVVADHPELVDINHPVDRLHPDWMHSNALDYNPFLDMIALSVPYFNEIWFIDHSTTTAQAASNIGGLSGIGGDLLYRWGNPAAYGAGDSSHQTLFFQHDVNWIDDHLPFSHPDFGKVAVFNNRVGADFSTAHIFAPVFIDYGHMFQMDNGRWLPEDFQNTYTHPTPTSLFSTGLSSVQVLPNSNVLICSGRFGYAFELTPTNEIVWEYKTPLLGGAPVEQGTELGINSNLTFRMHRYPLDYQAFEGRDLSSQGYIELNPNLTFCDSLTATMEPIVHRRLNIYPNPADEMITLEWEGPYEVDLAVYDIFGREKTKLTTYGGRTFINTSEWIPGYYFVTVNGLAARVVVIE